MVNQIKESSKRIFNDQSEVQRRIKASEEVLKILGEQGGKPLTLEDLNNDLIDCVKRVAVLTLTLTLTLICLSG